MLKVLFKIFMHDPFFVLVHNPCFIIVGFFVCVYCFSTLNLWLVRFA